MNAPAAPAAVQTSELPLVDIVPSNTHIQQMRRERFDPALLQELCNSIKEIGVLQAVVVRPTPTAQGFKVTPAYELVAGERRWLAAKIAGLTTIPATVRDLTDEQVLKAQLVENLQREGLHPLEEAEGYDELMKLEQLSADQVGTMIGKSRSYVFARLKLLSLAMDGRKAFYAGELDASRALYVARITNPKLQAKALELATQKGWKGEPAFSVRGLRYKLSDGEFSVTLKTSPFAREDTTFFELVKVKKGVEEPRPLPDCISCPNRTGNCLDLFSQDDDPDVCMDPACHAIKLRQHGERLRVQLEASGIQVITGDAAKKIAPRKGELAGFVDLDAPCADDESPEPMPEEAGDKAYAAWNERNENYQPRTFRQLLEGAPVDAIVIEDPSDGRVRTLVPYQQAKPLVKKLHRIELNDWSYGVRSQQHTPTSSQTAEEREANERKEEAQRERQEQERQFRVALLIQVHAKAGAAPLKRDDLALIAERLLDSYNTDQKAKEFFGQPVKPGGMKEPELLQLVRVLLVIDALDVHTPPQALFDQARRLKIDPDRIKKDLKAAAKATAQPAKKPAAKKAKKS